MFVENQQQPKRLHIDGSSIISHDGCVVDKDRVSGLPDDIKYEILSLLGMRAAVRTSVLSKKWRYSWTYWLDLDFDSEKILGLTSREPRKYVSWVNQVVEAHTGPLIKKFRISHYLNGDHTSSINKWLDFCLRKGVQDLELNCADHFTNYHCRCFTFGPMPQTSLTQDICMMPTFTNLRSFSAKSIEISGPLLELTISKCTFLEQLCVEHCKVLGGLKVVSPSLKFLEFTASRVGKVEVSAPNLCTIVFWSHSVDLLDVEYKRPPSLVEATFGGFCLKYFINQIFCYSFQLEKFSISASMVNLSSVAIPPLDSLKQLALSLDFQDGDDLFYLTHILDACPSLRKFKLELDWEMEAEIDFRLDWEMEAEIDFQLDWEMEAETTSQRQERANIYPCLEAVHVVGFEGSQDERRFLSYIVENAPLLKKFTLDSRDLYSAVTGNDLRSPSKARRSKKIAEELAREFPPTVDVVVI